MFWAQMLKLKLLANLALNFLLEIWQIYGYFLLKKCKAFHIFCSKNSNIFENNSDTTVNEFVINELVKPRML